MYRFANVEVLWWLLLLLPLVVVLLLNRWRRRRSGDAFASRAMQGFLMPYTSSMRFWVRSSFFLLGVVALIIGLARPQFGTRQVKTKREGVEIMLVVDVSNSMNAQDIKPSRLERAKLEISKLLERMHQDRIGMVLFAGRSYVQLPITNDYTTARMFLSSLNTGLIQEQGTALGEALELASQSFSPIESVGKAIIVISDGENHEDDPVSVAREIAEQGIRIYTVGMGSTSGVPIPEAGGGVKKDARGGVVLTRLDERTLQRVAEAGGGVYLRATSGSIGYAPILREIDAMQKSEFEDVVYASYREQYQLFFAIALVCFVLSTVILERKNPWVSVEQLYRRVKGGVEDA